MFHLTEPPKQRTIPSQRSCQSKISNRNAVPNDILTREFSNLHFLHGNLKLNNDLTSGLSDIKTCYQPDFGHGYERINYSDEEEAVQSRKYSKPWGMICNSILTNYAPKHSSLLHYI